jgi:hypothetical protein
MMLRPFGELVNGLACQIGANDEYFEFLESGTETFVVEL